jgi:hypothetical protein
MANKFKSLQVLRTTATLKDSTGTKIPSGSRVVVISQKGNKVTTRLDPRPDGTIGRQPRIVGERSDFAKTFRGRPKGSTKKAATVAAPVDVLSTPPQASAVAPAALPANSSSGLGL